MALLGIEGFEALGANAATVVPLGWSAVFTLCTTANTATPPRFGYGLSGNLSSADYSTWTRAQAGLSDPASGGTFIFGTAVRLYSTASVHFDIFSGDGTGTQQVNVHLTSTALTVRRGAYSSGTLLGSVTTIAFPVNVWHYVEIKAVIDDSSGIIVVRHNGQQVYSFSGDTRNAAGTAGIIGVRATAVTNTVSFDDQYFCDETGPAPYNDFLGDVRVLGAYPNGNGTTSQGTGSDGNSVDNYALVDEAGAWVTTDYVDFAAGQKDTYTFEDVGTDTAQAVLAVRVKTNWMKSDAGTALGQVVARVGGTDYTNSAVSLPSSSSLATWLMTAKPGGGAWTVGDVNSAEFGVVNAT